MPGDDEPPDDRVGQLERRVQTQAERIDELEQRLAAQPSPDTVKWLVSQVQGGGVGQPVDPEAMTTVERYAEMPLPERVDVLPASEMRATLLFENWSDWVRRGPYGDEFISTAQERPGTLRVLLRERDPTVSVSAGDDLAWNQVYRAMRALHRLTDGAFRYEEDHQGPDNTNGEKCHAVVLEAPGEMPTLPR